MTERALDGLRVVDISQGIAGPYATKLLADSGASVTKIEPPDGDYTRRLGPFPGDSPDPERSGLFLHLNTGKRSVTLDVGSEAGSDVVRRLLADAEVFVCSERTSRLKEWGLSYDDVKADFPELVFAQVSPFGATGPYADYDGNALTAMAMSTLMYGTGEPDREPLATGGEAGEFVAGVQLWVGILAALENRARTGGGDHVDVGMADAVACADEYNTAMYAFQGAIRRRYYSRHIFGYPMDIVRASDGHVVMIPGASGFLSPLAPPGSISPMALLFENPDLDENPLFRQTGERMVRWKEFDELIKPFLESHTASEIVMTAQALRMPFAFVPDANDLLNDDHLADRGFFETIEHPQAGALKHTGAPFKMSETPLQTGPAPLLDEASEEIAGRV
jgi:crotonobetainyl-CoA:carnitine CoA-transferase CaiB-like acyl-CoA transferase